MSVSLGLSHWVCAHWRRTALAGGCRFASGGYILSAKGYAMRDHGPMNFDGEFSDMGRRRTGRAFACANGIALDGDYRPIGGRGAWFIGVRF